MKKEITLKQFIKQHKKKMRNNTAICDVCGIDVVFNLNIYKRTGMCGTCSTGEARLNYEED